ncbi:MAG: serine/threonine-protein kinase [Kiritimatiellae bacterium]|nr:serine/threonine-protein kinase [Kiritimatiellia bacterium]MDD5520042.1 serine/threonine-protein kinase [Kiritimatiellia bacterium]
MDPESKDIGILTDRVSEATCGKCGCKIDVADLEPFLGVECPDCGSVENVPAKLGQFLLLHLIGKGGMGGVYYAEDTALGRHVAIKVMLQSLGDNHEFVETFKREAQAVAKLNHPNIVQIYAFGKEKGQPYIVMELVSGQRLDKMMEGGTQVDQALVMKISVDVADALKAADEIGLIHGDIKPENILLDEKGQAKLVDFGLATFAHQAAGEGVWGTPYYIAPEKIRRQPADARSDIYSLGATLYHALTGKPPFEGTTPIDVVKARLERDPVGLSILRPKIDRFVESIVMRMLQRQPVKRYPNYASLLGDLRKAVQTLGPVKTGAFSVKKQQTLIVSKHRTSPITINAKTGEVKKTDESGVHKPAKIYVTAGGGKEEPDSPIDTYKQSFLQKLSSTKREKLNIKIPKWVYWLAVIGLVIWGISGIILHSKHKKEQAREYKIEQLNLNKEKTIAEQKFTMIQLAVTNICKMNMAADSCMDKVTNAVFVVTGDIFSKQAPKPQPIEPVVNASNAVQDATSSNAVPPVIVEPVATNAPAKKTKPAKAKVKKEGDGPPGEATREELDQMRNQAKDANKPAAAPTPVAPPPAVALPPAVVAPVIPENEPEIKTLARKTLEIATKLIEKADSAKSIEEASEILKTDAFKARTSFAAGLKNKELATQLESIKAIESETKELFTECEKTTKQIESIRMTFEEEVQARKKAQEEEAKKMAEAEAAKRKADELKALIENEKKLVETARKNCVPMLKLYDFKGALDSVASQAATFQTDEGKTAIRILVDRYTYLQKLKLFLVERLKVGIFQWGWLSPSQDILGADMTGIKIRGKTVSWSEVNGVQLLRIINHCLADKGVQYKVKAENALAAAILCYELGGVVEAKKYAEQAVNFSVSMKDDVTRLLTFDE